MTTRKLSLLQAVSLNMGMMVGVGPFITIPPFLAAMGGPQAMVGWLLGLVVAFADGLVWCELAAAFPGPGGTFHFYDAVYGRSTVGRALKFLFVWQFLFSGPLELASGAIGLGNYAGFLWAPLEGVAWRWPTGGGSAWAVTWGQVGAAGAMMAIVGLAYRRVEVAGRLMVVLWAGMLVTVAAMIAAGVTRFDPRLAFDFPPDAWRLDGRFASGLGVALGIAMYDYLGYYQVCYLGDEVADPARTLPRAILISTVAVASIYLTMNLSILGVLPWREVIGTRHVASDFMLARFGPGAARAITWMILWTGATSVFAGILGYSRVPYAAARSGHFFRSLAAIHPKGGFPHRSLLLVGTASAVACLFPLDRVIAALLTSRILVQFVGQVATCFYLRSRADLRSRLLFVMPLFPLPALVALVAWLYVFGTTSTESILYGLGSLVAGVVAFAAWRRWAGDGDG
ncbi:APC family permease [Tundrisphaera sp. TA3]|uniref:APC family permease n=1 Tax=Tundrisphaera sp. TA3 TaxID=3435775 RepID=UPI003EB7EFEA